MSGLESVSIGLALYDFVSVIVGGVLLPIYCNTIYIYSIKNGNNSSEVYFDKNNIILCILASFIIILGGFLKALHKLIFAITNGTDIVFLYDQLLPCLSCGFIILSYVAFSFAQYVRIQTNKNDEHNETNNDIEYKNPNKSKPFLPIILCIIFIILILAIPSKLTIISIIFLALFALLYYIFTVYTCIIFKFKTAAILYIIGGIYNFMLTPLGNSLDNEWIKQTLTCLNAILWFIGTLSLYISIKKKIAIQTQNDI